MSKRYIGLAVAAMLAIGAASAADGSNGDGGRDRRGARFDLALIGDLPYRPGQDAQFDAMIEEINSEKISFTVHVGDINSGSSPCADDVYLTEYERFNTFSAPLVYTPGDNEWTDCHRPAAGGYDPLERLEFLREVFFSEPSRSLGARRLRLAYQSEEYPENARWSYGKVMFATLHIVGSNNNLGRNPENDAEYAARDAANLAWLDETFEAATAEGSAAVVLAIQANTFEANTASPSGFDNFVTELRTRALEFGKPVLLLHGDTHYFRVDKPLLDPNGSRILDLTRAESFGDADVGWVRVAVDPSDPEVFSFQAETP